MRRSRQRRQRGQSLIETVIGVMILSLVFFGAVQVAYLYIAQLIAHHTAFVTARSYSVGFNNDIVERAKEVGSIGLAGPITMPAEYTSYNMLQLGAVEPDLIATHVQNKGYSVYYSYWSRVYKDVPLVEVDGVVPVTIRVYDYPANMPMHGAYMDRDAVDIESTVHVPDYAAYYLQ